MQHSHSELITNNGSCRQSVGGGGEGESALLQDHYLQMAAQTQTMHADVLATSRIRTNESSDRSLQDSTYFGSGGHCNRPSESLKSITLKNKPIKTFQETKSFGRV
jgi:hypothetical protein